MNTTTAPHILVIDDDPNIRELVVEYLGNNELRVSAGASGRELFELVDREAIDLVLLDLKLPGEDGMQLARALRERAAVPIIFLTGRNEEADRVMGLELGADDYVTKPFSPRELLARVRAVLRRAEQRSGAGGVGAGCEFAGWRLDLVRRELRSPQGVVVNLSSGEFSLLRAFVERPQRVLTRDQLLEYARGPQSDAFDRAIDVQISRLRRKLDDGGGAHELIRTIRNEGYMFTAKVKRT